MLELTPNLQVWLRTIRQDPLAYLHRHLANIPEAFYDQLITAWPRVIDHDPERGILLLEARSCYALASSRAFFALTARLPQPVNLRSLQETLGLADPDNLKLLRDLAT